MMRELTNHEYYLTKYKSDLVPQESFDRLMIKATSKVNYFTSNRISSSTLENENINTQVQDCVCEIIELLYTQEQLKETLSKEKQVQSETVGPISKTYSNNSNLISQEVLNDTELDDSIYQICATYLIHTGLMYRGI